MSGQEVNKSNFNHSKGCESDFTRSNNAQENDFADSFKNRTIKTNNVLLRNNFT